MTAPNPSPLFPKLDRNSLVQQVADSLIHAIVQGQIEPGEKLSESVIAKQFGVSRAPVREAARLLESKGLLVYEPNRGFFIRAITAHELDQLFELRILIETAAIARFVEQDPTPYIPILKQQIDRMISDADTTDTQAHIQGDLAFHRIITTHCGNARFLSVFDQLAQEIELSVMLVGQVYADPILLARSHLPILEAIESGDPNHARTTMHHHLQEAREHVVAQFK